MAFCRSWWGLLAGKRWWIDSNGLWCIRHYMWCWHSCHCKRIRISCAWWSYGDKGADRSTREHPIEPMEKLKLLLAGGAIFLLASCDTVTVYRPAPVIYRPSPLYQYPPTYYYYEPHRYYHRYPYYYHYPHARPWRYWWKQFQFYCSDYCSQLASDHYYHAPDNPAWATILQDIIHPLVIIMGQHGMVIVTRNNIIAIASFILVDFIATNIHLD